MLRCAKGFDDVMTILQTIGNLALMLALDTPVVLIGVAVAGFIRRATASPYDDDGDDDLLLEDTWR